MIVSEVKSEWDKFFAKEEDRKKLVEDFFSHEIKYFSG